ncbi:cytosine/adenosine deaminase-related metal-dependent hydrolase [Paenibacillus forsythiae]|uniref:5-methylthioadenosine/S-adenosylhomocysteine deaminase n=1 Tax=Paenibacillus forsythiae TaxID=365616 RepID=A0ABU3HC36_9BACL|nr:5'-deoxyadenosine deaminase [Paenibacillus forsythiae]MDT3428374.1 cytosine/adenosine deaminase-related metal-dependent hydrolase [Paenibacillus forsythiae]
MSGILIKNAELITMNKQEEILRGGDIRIKDDLITEIGRGLAPLAGETVIDATGRTVIPGFVQTHIHLCQTLFRGKADDLELMDWLRKRIWPLEAAHDGESLYYSAMLGIGELISSGTTTIVDMETVHHTDYAFQAIAKSGIRALSGKVMMDQKGGDVPEALQEETGASLQESVDLLEKWNGYDGGRIRYAFSPRFVISCTEPLLTEVRDLSARYGVKVHTHASENLGEIEIVQAMTGMRNIVYLDHIGLANERLILAHCIWLDEEERRILRERGVHVSHCPGSNLKLASGIADTPGLIHEHVSVSLGADGAPCNNNLDMFNEMRLAALIQKPLHGPTTMDAKSVFRMATIGGAKAVGMEDEIGSIEVGKKADLAILNLYNFHTFPSFDVDPISRIVYSATRADVESTIINGKIVMDRGVLKTVDKETVLREADRSIERLLTRTTLG